MRILILQGPNLNLSGQRERDIYGVETLDHIYERLQAWAEQEGVALRFIQSNHEGALIDDLHRAKADGLDGVIFNPVCLTFYSYAVRDALSVVDLPTVEVHLSNLYKREQFRHHSVLASVCVGQIMGFGGQSYLLALEGLVGFLRSKEDSL